MKNYKIYCLKDPKTQEIRYIGVTTNTLSQRLSQHKHDALKRQTQRHVLHWIKSLYINNQVPIIELVENCTKDNWEERERYWISFYKNLTNASPGGKGVIIDRDISGKQRSANAHKKQISLLTKEFELVKHFDSINACAEYLQVHKTAIGHVLSKRHRHVKGYVVVSKDDYDNENYNKVFTGRSKTVYQYDLVGKLIMKFNTLAEVYHFNNDFKTNHIHAACKNLWIHKGFIWSYQELNNIMEIIKQYEKRILRYSLVFQETES